MKLNKTVSYFTAHHLRGGGTFQDGGLTFNNPASIAIKEAAALFPTAPEPSVVVSLGTGSASPAGPDSRTAALWEGTFPARLYRAFWKQGDSSAAWGHVVSRQDAQAKGEYFRFDVQFDGEPPALDDARAMGRVAHLARDTALGSPEVERLARCLRAELFVFELDGSWQPRLRNGAYRCEGHIYCRLRAGTEEFEALMRQLAQRSASFQCQGKRLQWCIPPTHQLCDLSNFRLPVVFHVANRQAPCRITLQEGPADDTCNISGSPFTLERLMAQQQFGASFGREDHQ